MAEGARYQLVRELGAGGMGAVRLVWDAERQQEVAQKRIRTLSPSALLRFKREFRAVERLLHPNLVRLYELGEDDEGVYFTMEAVNGADLGVFCALGMGDSSAGSGDRGTAPGSAAETVAVDADAPTVDGAMASGVRTTDERAALPRDSFDRVLARVLHVTPQIVEALSFLHARGIVHRDLKPPNVLIDQDGVVKLLDFGVLAMLRDPVSTDAGTVVGTVGYIAPEQLRGAEAVPASDLYALGATLFTLLTGREVFGGETPMQKIVAHIHQPPPAVDELAPGTPAPLVEACSRLLAKDPRDRPTLAELGELLTRAGARAPVLARPERERPELFGREQECRRLEGAVLEPEGEGARLVVLRGPSGAGKSALADWVAEQAARGGSLVLRGRGRANDQLAFNAVDGAVDQLAMALGRHRRLAPETRAAAATAATAFPVLAEIEPPIAASERVSAFDAVVTLLDREMREHGGVVLVDDLQWADSDSLALLRHVVRSASAQVSIVATLRDDQPDAPAHRLLSEVDDALVVEVGALGAAALERVVRRAAEEAGGEPSDGAVARAVAAAAGRPFVAEVAGRALARRDGAEGDPLARVVAEAMERDADLLAALLAADGWTPLGVLARIADGTPGAVDDRVRELALEGIVRRAGPTGQQGAVDVYHDAVRTALAEVVTETHLRRAHGAFADAIAAGELSEPPQRLVRHLLGAGRTDQAAGAAREAAAHAERQLAFGLAADMYAVALEHGPAGDRELWRRRAEALERSARYAEAAPCWQHLADTASGVEAAHASMNAANALLAANRVAEGVERLDAALGAVGDPPVGSQGMSGWLAALRFLRGPGSVQPRPGPHDEEDAARAACDLKIGLMVGYFDPFAGVKVLRRARDAYARLGDREQLAWCDYLFAAFGEHGSSSPDTPRLARRYRESADAVCAAHELDSPRLRAIRLFLDGSEHLRATRWTEADRAFERAVAELDEAGLRGVFEQTYALSQRGVIAFFRHDPAGLDVVLDFYRSILGGYDSAILSHERLFATVAHAFRARWEEARAAAAEVRAALPEDVPTIQRSLANVVLRVPELIAPDGAERLRVLDAAERKLIKRFRLFDINVGGVYSGLAALVEACALRSGHGDASPGRLKRYARLSMRSAPVAGGIPERALAYLADARGRPERALEQLALAERRAADHGRPTAAHIARFQRGLRLGGDEGRALCDQARAHVRAAGVTEAVLSEDPALR